MEDGKSRFGDVDIAHGNELTKELNEFEEVTMGVELDESFFRINDGG